MTELRWVVRAEGRRLAGAVVVGLALLLAGGRVRLADDMASLVPADGPIASSMADFRRFAVGDTVLVSVDGAGAEPGALAADVSQIAAALEASGAFSRVRWRVEAADGVSAHQALEGRAVALTDADLLAERTSEAGITTQLLRWRARLAGPAGALVARQLQADPLDLGGAVWEDFRSSGPFHVVPRDGLLGDRDGEQALIVAETARRASEGGQLGAADAVRAALAGSRLPTHWFGGPRIAAETESAIRGDASRATAIGIAGILAVFVLAFRGFEVALGAVGPVGFGALAATGMAGLLSPVHGINLGFASAFLGIGVDYYVHLAVTASARGGETPRARLDDAHAALRELRPWLLISTGSNAAAFLLLLASAWPVVQVLGAMGATTSFGALLGVHLLGPAAYAALGARPVRAPSPGAGPWRALISAVVVAVCAVGATNLTFDGDPRSLNRVSDAARLDEASIAARFGGAGVSGMVVVEAPDLDAALERAFALDRALREVSGLVVSSPTRALPPPSVRAARAAALPPVDVLRARVSSAAEAAGFEAAALLPAIDALYSDARPIGQDTWDGTPVGDLVGRHVRVDADGAAVMLATIAQDDGMAQEIGRVVAAVDPAARVVQPALVARAGVRAVRDEVLRLGGLALVLVVGTLIAWYRSPRLVVAAMVPVGVALAVAAGAGVALGVPWNAVSAAAMVLVVGLSLDYGVNAVEGRRLGHADLGAKAVLVCMATTVLGFGAMVVAENPAMFGVGLGISAGLISGAFASFWLSPVVLGEVALPRLARPLAFAALAFAHADVAVFTGFPLDPPRPDPGPVSAVREGGRLVVGRSRMETVAGVRAMYLEGDGLEMGRAHGALTADLREGLEDDLVATFHEHLPSAVSRWAVVRGAMVLAPGLDQHLHPFVRDELWGLATSTPDPHPELGPPYTRKVYFQALHDIGQALVDSPLMACTGFVAGPGATPDGHWRLGRNFDFDGGARFDREKIVAFRRPSEGFAFASVGFGGAVGTVTGINEHRLAVAIQAAGTDDPIRPGTPMIAIVREVLQFASSIDEAEALFSARRGFVSDSVLIIDGRRGEAAILEVSPSRVARTDVPKVRAVANHFRHADYANDATNAERARIGTTTARLARMDELLARHDGAIDQRVAVEILTDRAGVGDRELPRGHEAALNADVATHGVVIDATSGEIWVSRSPNLSGGFVRFDLDRGLAGDLSAEEVAPAVEPDRALAVHRGRALVRRAKGWWFAEDREASAREALAWMPVHPDALLLLAEALADQGRWSEVGPLLDQVAPIVTRPSDTERIDALRGRAP
jgi:predicted exporter